MDIDFIKSLLEDFDPAKFLPDIQSLLGKVELLLRIAVLVGPLILLGMGLVYFLAAPKEANHSLGYRFYFGMGSVEAWQFTQRLAGALFSLLGLVLTIVMALICNGFRGMDMDTMTYTAGKCLLWQIGLCFAACIVINITVTVLFDRNGIRRTWGKRPPEDNSTET